MAMTQAALAQPPQIVVGGVLNAASYTEPLSPGSVVSIFGANLAATQASAPGTPLPVDLAGTSVTVNGVKAPLFFVSPTQINLQLPSSLQTSTTAYTSATVVVTTAAGSSAPAQATVFGAGPAMFTADASGCGQAAVLNVAADGTTSPNSAANSAAPGDYISLFGTGLGLAVTQPPDGTPASGVDPLQSASGVSIDGNTLAAAAYQGLAPALVGVNQINLRIPDGTREGCAVPVVVGAGSILSTTATIAIHSGRGRCVDPGTQSYGEISLTKTTSSGTSSDGVTEIFAASFPAGPARQPATPTIPPPGSYIANVETPVPASRFCPVAGYAQLSAGPIQVRSGGTGSAVTAQPLDQLGGVSYRQSLPAGFIAPGPYSISASGGAVAFQGTMPAGSPVEITTSLVPGTQVPLSGPFTVRWKGGDTGAKVKVTLTSRQGIVVRSDYTYADATAGSVMFDPACSGSVCTLGLAASSDAMVTVEVSPAPGSAVALDAQGITGKVTASWTYRYIFGGLVLR